MVPWLRDQVRIGPSARVVELAAGTGKLTRLLPPLGQFEEFHHEHVVTPEDVVRRVASASHVAVLPDDARAGVLEEVREILFTDPTTRGREYVAIPYRVDCSFARRR